MMRCVIAVAFACANVSAMTMRQAMREAHQKHQLIKLRIAERKVAASMRPLMEKVREKIESSQEFNKETGPAISQLLRESPTLREQRWALIGHKEFNEILEGFEKAQSRQDLVREQTRLLNALSQQRD